jgi:hypothetical protein
LGPPTVDFIGFFTGMKQGKLKDNVPQSPDEWLEYQEHRERWTPEMQKVLDKFIKDTFPVAPEDEESSKKSISNGRKHG